MPRGNRTGRGCFQKGQSGNPGGITGETRRNAEEFKQWAFGFFQKNKENFEDMILSDQKTAMDFIKMLPHLCPKEIDLGNKDGEPLLVRWQS